MSNQLIDWRSDKGIEIRNNFIQLLMEKLLRERLVQLMPKTCISCGSSTQPCCGH